MRRLAGVVTVAVAVGLVVGLSLRLGTGHSGAASNPVVTPPAASRYVSGAFYLAVGASSSLGYQPMGIPGGREHATKRSYANDLVELQAKRGVKLSLLQIGCPGETAASMLTAVDHCFPTTNGQLHQAVQFLQGHRNQAGVVTVDLGFNDVRACLTRPTLDQGCANAGVAAVRRSMPKVLKELQSAAGPRVRFVGMLVADPFLAHYLHGPSGRTDAAATLTTMNQLNAVLRADFAAAHIPVADVAFTFQSDDQNLVSLAGVGPVPTNVAAVCHLTWMCSPSPWGPDDHPNDVGYMAIAKTVDAVLANPSG